MASHAPQKRIDVAKMGDSDFKDEHSPADPASSTLPGGDEFRELIENSIQGVMVARGGKPLFVNQVLASMHGYSVDEILALPSNIVLYHPDEHARVGAFRASRMAGDNSVRRFVVRNIRKNGSTFWTEQLSTPIRWRGQKATQIVLVDISERKFAEDQLAALADHYRTLFENAPIAMYRSGPDRKFIEVNAKFQQLLGYDATELIGRRPRELIPSEETAAFEPQLAALWAGAIDRVEVEHRMTRKDGRTIWVISSASLGSVAGSDKRYNIVHIQDVTERRAAQRELRDRAQRYRETFENAPIAMLRAGRDNRIIEVNRAFEELLGYPQRELVGRFGREFGAESEREAGLSLIGKVWRGESERVEYESVLVRKDGGMVPVLIVANLTPDDAGEPNHLLIQIQDITARKAAEEAVKEREASYRGLVDNSIQGIAILQQSGFTFVNDAFCQIFGYGRDELIGLAPYMFHPDNRDELLNRATARMSGDLSSRRYEMSGVRRDGKAIWVEYLTTAVEWHGTRATQVVAIDITSRKIAERRLADSEKQYRELFDNAPVAMCWISPRGEYVRTNRALQDMLGYSSDELLQMHPLDTVHPDAYQLALDGMTKLTNGGSDFVVAENRHLRKDGREIWVLVAVRVIRNDTGAVRYILAQLQDITERKIAEYQLRQAQSQYRELFENAPVAMGAISLAGEFIQTNQAYRDLLGYSTDDLARMSALDTVASRHRAEIDAGMARSREGKGPDRSVSERELVCKDGRTIWVLLSASIVRDADQKPRYLLSHLQDITARKIAEEQLFQSQKMESLGNLAGGIAHDFNNMLLPIVALSEITRDELPAGSSGYENLTTVIEAANQASRLVQQILTFSRQNEREVNAFDISQCVAEAVQLLRNVVPATIRIREEIETGVGTVMADRSQLLSVMMNLGSNAVDAMEAKVGELVIALDRIAAGQKLAMRHSHILNGQDYARITVSDTGCGMDRATMEKIFDPFFTTKPVGEGTGLGLSMVHGIIERLEGAVDVTSAPGEGATFTIYLPLCSDFARPIHAVDPEGG